MKSENRTTAKKMTIGRLIQRIMSKWNGSHPSTRTRKTQTRVCSKDSSKGWAGWSWGSRNNTGVKEGQGQGGLSKLNLLVTKKGQRAGLGSWSILLFTNQWTPFKPIWFDLADIKRDYRDANTSAKGEQDKQEKPTRAKKGDENRDWHLKTRWKG